MKFHIRTLGCKLNQLDSARLAGALVRAGHEAVGSEREADCVLVNTCTVTAESDRKSRQAARGAARGDHAVVVLGCSARTEPARWRAELPGALVFDDEEELYTHFGASAHEPAAPLTSRTRLPVAIQTGCDDTCAFCVTRLARGRHRSLPVEQVVHRVRQAEEGGVREVVLTGVNLAAWGCEDTRRPEGARLAELIRRLLADTGMPRIRLSSLGPQYLLPPFFEVLADPRVCDHLHLSVQSGAAGVLRRMRRGHGPGEVLQAAERARAVRPDVALAADVIAGFPGETDGEHRESLGILEAVGFAKLHVFPFSLRPGTPAADLPDQLPAAVRSARARELRELGAESRAAFLRSQLGKPAEVLVERDGTGLTTNYVRLRIPGIPEGEIAPARITPEALADRG